MDMVEMIVARPTVPQVKMTEPGPDEIQIQRLLAAGAAAPDHGVLRPWRFLVVHGEARRALGELFARAALAADPRASAADVEKQRTAPLRAPLLIVVVTRIERRPGKFPEVEQICSAAAGAQNILLAAHAMGFAGKWSTGKNAYDPMIKAGLGVDPDDHVIGFLYIGSYAAPHQPSPRPALTEVTRLWSGPPSS
jgi:nitroreductase